MAFSRLDIMLIIPALIVMIAVNFTFPALGLTPTNTTQADIPDFNMSKGAVKIVPGQPEFPSRPSEGTLKYRANAQLYEDNRQVFLQGNSQDGNSITLIDGNNNVSNPQPEVTLNDFNPSSPNNFTSKFINESEFKTIDNYSYIISFEDTEITNETQPNMTMTVDWAIERQPSDTSWLGRIPVIGGIVGSGEQLAAVLGWGISMVWYPIEIFIRASTTAGNVLWNIVSFGFELGYWFLSTYSSIVNNAPADFVKLILSIPALALSIEFARIIYNGIQLLPLT